VADIETQQEDARPKVRPPAAGHQVGEMQFFLDIPSGDKEIHGAFVPVRGWVWHPDGVETVEARTTKGSVPAMVRFGRADVFKALLDHPYGFHTGFYIEVERTMWDGSAELWIQTCKGEWGKFHTLNFTLHDEDFQRAQEKLMSVLVCPECHRPTEQYHPACDGCRRPVEWMGEVPSFLGLQPSPLARGEPVSRHAALEEIAPEYFDIKPDSILLDAGAGWPPKGRGEVIQLEIERFPSTNVVADGSQLPFRAETFDGIISHAVMEHVKDPFGYAQELMRVLKPGARFICHSAFLQPVHAYPHHYFNTTLEGLKVLFKGARIVEAGVASFQRPWLALEWILRSYCHGLTDDAERERFKQMKIADLLGDMDEDRPLSDFQSLTEEANLELAAGVYILGEC
jgi:SAM-dependent methyltransferase